MPAVGTPPSTAHSFNAEVDGLSNPSPNFGERKGGVTPGMVVIHYTAMRSADAACRTLCNPDTEVSSHYLIAEDGRVMSLVAEKMRAWHAGAGRWGDVSDVNSHSIGIELANDGFSPFSHKQMDALEYLIEGVCARWNISRHRVIGHSDLAPGRKIDPGPRFDWQRLVRRGMAVWPEVAQAEPKAFHKAACAFGYSPDVDDATRLAAFRLRFRFGYDGPLDAVDAGMAVDLAERFGIET